MTELTLSAFYKKDALQEEKLKRYIAEYGIDSLLNVRSAVAFSIE